MNIGEKIRALRESEGLTIRKLAELSEVNYTQLAKIENGVNVPTISTATKILTQLGKKLEIVEMDFENQQ